MGISNDKANTHIQEEDTLHYMKKMLRYMNFIAYGGHELSQKITILIKKSTRICKFVDEGNSSDKIVRYH